LGLAEPQQYDEKYSKWRYADLPIAPTEWKYTAAASTEKQLNILTALMKRSDIETVINACDSGREGELIFRLVYNHAKCTKPIKRLWISSMEESAILDGFKNLKDGADFERLYISAKCRQQADWLVGMNYSRLFSVLYDSSLRVGRVQTPTLAMITEREQKISDFVKEPFYVVGITDGSITAEREKIKDKSTADKICSDCSGKTAVVKSVYRQEKSVSAPKLYDLTTLQREANRFFGYTATQTLNAAQSLYEQKIVTYPRTDSRFITEDMRDGIPSLLQSMAGILPFSVRNSGTEIAQITNNSKVTDHHAIIPTPTISSVDLSALPTTERNIFNMICVRLFSAVSERYIYAETIIVLDVDGEAFTAKGKTISQIGWKSIEQAFLQSIGKNTKDGEKPLPDICEGNQFLVTAAVREDFTQPLCHFTEDILLKSMETAGDMPNNAERRGLGTPATRAAIIENLIKSGLLERKDKLLLPTEKGKNLIKILPDSVKSPLLTAEWENNLKRIEQGVISEKDFMTAINCFVADTIKSHSSVPNELKSLFPSNLQQAGEAIGKCPRCGGSVTDLPKGFFCENKSCKFALWRNNRFFESKKKQLTKDVAIALLTKGRVFMSGLFSEKTQKKYNATIILDDNGDGYPNFKMEFENKK